jgi:TonB family protein
MATQTQSFLQGEVVEGRYPLLRYLGGSEHSAVFLTRHGTAHPADAAIKLMPARSGSAEAQLSLWRLVANLSHPHLIRILDMGRCQLGNTPTLYLVTELAGENLAEILPQRALTAEETREMLASLLDALAFMHSRGFVHGHIKPSNIMAVGEQLKLSSDSICRLGDAVESNGSTSVYDAPEGNRGGASRKADIWSLGVTLVEVLTQEPPEWTPSDRRDPVPPETMPPPFAEIARHCLRRDPKNRWAAATIQSHLPRTVPTPAARVIARVTERAPQARRYAVGASGLVVVLALIFAGVKLLGPSGNAPNSAATTSEVQSPAKTGPSSKRPSPPAARPATTDRARVARVMEHAAPDPKHVAPAMKPVSPPVRTAEKRPGVPPATAAPREYAPAAAAAASPSSRSAETDAPRISGGGMVAGRVLQRVMPDVPKKASDTIWGTVRVGVKVRVDASGNVTQAELESAGPSRYFARLSLEAARKWHFAPPMRDGRGMASVWILHFGYRNNGLGVEPSQTEP